MSAPSCIECTDLVVDYGPTRVLDHVSCTIEGGSVFGLVGSSGAGKTTLLRVIAGLQHPASGSVAIDGDDKADTSASGRRVGMVFQQLALWPHLTAMQHIEYVLSSVPRRIRRLRAEGILAEVRLPADAWQRRPGELSGGESQRLALARALAPQPRVLLLDEPLAQVDAVLHAELLDLIAAMVRTRTMTVVYVTHHWQEAVRLSERVAVMSRGKLIAEGSPPEVYWNPPTPEAARLSGPVMVVPGRWFRQGMIAGEASSALLAPSADSPGETLLVRPQQVRVVASDGANCWKPCGCRPSESGWHTTLACGQDRLELLTASPLSPNERVGIEIVVKADALGHR